MLVNPEVKIYKEFDDIILEVEDEGTIIKLDITSKILDIIDDMR